MSGLFVLVTVLVVTSSVGVALRRRQGKFKTSPRSGDPSRDDDPSRDEAPSPPAAPSSAGALTPEDIGAPLGERATLVQLSTEFCANCPPTKRLLGQVAAENPGVEFVEVDAAARLDLARRLNIYATPTILVLGPDGRIASRASGQPRKSDVLAAVGSVLEPDVLQADVVNLGGR
jgi:thiol-disulfide isomerase/thioredoxin